MQQRHRPESVVNLLLIIVTVLSILGFLFFIYSSFDTETESNPSFEASVIVGDGIQAALRHEDPSVDAGWAAKEAVDEALDATDLDLQEQASDALTRTATNEAAEAAVNIIEETTTEVERSVSELAESASPDEVADAATAIIDSAIVKLDLESGALDQENVVSDAATAAVFEAFRDEDVQSELALLELTADEEERLQTEVAKELASNIVRVSEEATQDMVDQLPPAIVDTFQDEVTERIGEFSEKAASAGVVGISPMLLSAIAAVFSAVVRRPVMKLEADSGSLLHYAVAVPCTIEEVRLEKPLSPFRNMVLRGTPVGGKHFPIFIDSGSDEFEFQFDEDPRSAWSWNIQLIWFKLTQLRVGGDGSWDKYTYAFLVNGRWQSYPIEMKIEQLSTSNSGNLQDKPQSTRHEPLDESDDEIT